MELTTITIGLLLLFLFIWKNSISNKFKDKQNQLPPGPPRLPFVGSFPFMPRDVKNGVKRMDRWLLEKYGTLSSFFVNNCPFIFVADVDLVRQLYKMEAASARPVIKPFHDAKFGDPNGSQRGLLSSSGAEWREQRRFALRNLKNFGFGKIDMEVSITEEVDKLIEMLRQDGLDDVNLNRRLNVSIVNALWVLLVGERLALDNPKLLEIVDHLDDLIRGNSRSNPLIMCLPVPLIRRFLPQYKTFMNVIDKIKALVEPYINEHSKTLNEAEDRDFVDVYLKEIAKTTDVNSSFNGKRGIESLITVLIDLFLAGTETTSSSIMWTILFLLHNPKVQDRIHEEIDKVVQGSGRRVTLADRPNMPYFQAVIFESMRKASIIPGGLIHSLTQDVELQGYKLPKGSSIVVNMLHIHHNPGYWVDPEVFRPERFYDDQSKTCNSSDHLIPFLVGKRFCLGQSLAEKELFLFLAGLLQTFEFKTSGSLPDDGLSSGVVIGAVRSSPLYKVNMRER